MAVTFQRWLTDRRRRCGGLPTSWTAAWPSADADADAWHLLAGRPALEGGSTGPAPPSWWDEAVRLKDDMSLRELADHLGVPVSQLVAELRQRGVGRQGASATPAPEPRSTPPARAPSRRSGSKDVQIEAYFHLLGKVPDSEVARMSGVSVRTVASYRARNDIGGYDGPRRRPPPRGDRRSKVGAYDDLLGLVPDRVVAQIAGMSLGAVRNYRVKKGIAPAGRMRMAEIDRILAAHRAGGPRAAAPTEGVAWQVLFDGDDTPVVVLAADLASAVVEAERLAVTHGPVRGLERLGDIV